MMHGLATERLTDSDQNFIPFLPVLTRCANLYQLVGVQSKVNFLEDGIGQSLVSDQDNRAKCMGGSAKSAAGLAGERGGIHR